MSLVDGFLKKMKVVSDDDYDDYDDYDNDDDEFDDDEELAPRKKNSKKVSAPAKKAKKSRDSYEDMDYDFDDEEEYSSPYSQSGKRKSAYSKPEPAPAPKRPEPVSDNGNVVGMRPQRGAGSEVCMIVPKSFEDANTIADVLLSHRAVVLNLEGIDMSAAQRIIDFASGACYTVGGNLQKISKKIFMIVPQDMNLSGDFDALLSDMVDLNSTNMMK